MVPKFTLVRLLIQDTGTYNQQVSRPYQAKTLGSALDDLSNRISSATRADPTARINGNLIAGLSHNLVSPVANWDRQLYIPNGWQEPRLRFTLEVSLDTAFGTEVYFFQGYTENKDVSVTGTINPDMVFFINSYLRINRGRGNTGMAMGGFRDTFVEAAQVIDWQVHAINATGQVYGLRP
jgi:hypothetical protein